MRFRNVDERYDYVYRKQERLLGEFADEKKMLAETLIYLCKCGCKDMPDDVYRACAFFINGEYNAKPGSLWLLYQAAQRLLKEIEDVPRRAGA